MVSHKVLRGEVLYKVFSIIPSVVYWVVIRYFCGEGIMRCVPCIVRCGKCRREAKVVRG